MYCDHSQSLRLKMASKRRNVFHKNKTQETTENEVAVMVRRTLCLWLVVVAVAAYPSPSARNSQLMVRPQEGLPSPYLLDPTLYLIAAPQLQYEDESAPRGKRTGPSLSIAEPIDVLRNRVMAQLARQRLQKQNENQVLANRMFLKTIGKRQALLDRSEAEDAMEYYKNIGEPDWDSSS